MQDMTYQIRSSVAINIADKRMCKESFGLTTSLANKVTDTVTAEGFAGFKPGVTKKEFIKAIKDLGVKGIGPKTASKLEAAGAFKTVYYVVVDIKGEAFRVGKAFHSRKELRPLLKEISRWKEKNAVPSYVKDRGVKVTTKLVTRMELLMLKGLTKDGPSIFEEDFVVSHKVKPAEKKRSFKVVNMDNLPVSQNSFHVANRGVIGLSDMLITFGAEAFRMVNRKFVVEIPNIDKEGKMNGFTRESFFRWDEHLALNMLPKDPKLFRELRLAQEDKGPKDNEEFRDAELLSILTNMSSMSGLRIAYEESEGTSLDHGTVPYPTSFRADRKGDDPDQEALNGGPLTERRSYSTLEDKCAFFLKCEASYYTPEYTLYSKLTKLPVVETEAKSSELKDLRKKIKELPGGEERDALEAKAKKLRKKPAVTKRLVDCSRFFRELTDSERDTVIELLGDKQEKENHLSRKQLKKVKRAINSAAGPFKWEALRWEEQLAEHGPERGDYWRKLDVLFHSDGPVYMSAEYKEDEALEKETAPDWILAMFDAMNDAESKERYFTDNAVVHQQTMDYWTKRNNQDMLEVELIEGVPSREVMVRMPDGSLQEHETQAFPNVENPQTRHAIMDAAWNGWSVIPGDSVQSDSNEEDEEV